MNAENAIYFDSFWVEHIPKEIRKLIGNKNVETYISGKQAYDSIICGCLCIRFIDFMLKGKSLLMYTFFCANKYKKTDKIMLKYFQQNLNKLKCIVMFVINIEHLKN